MGAKLDPAIGQAFKRLRQSKELAGKEVASEKLSYSQLMKFEKGQTSITVERFFDALLSFNVSAKEFQRAYQTLTQSEDVLFHGYIVMAHVQKNVAKLEDLLQKTQKRRQLEPDKRRHRLNEIEIRAFLYDLDKRRKLPARDIQFLRDYLLHIREWSEYEIWLLANTAPIFELDQLCELTEQLLHPSEDLIWLVKNQRKINIALLNVVKRLTIAREFERAASYLKVVEKQISNDLEMYEKAVLYGTKQLVALAQDSKNVMLQQQFLACLQALALFDSFDTINFLREFAHEAAIDLDSQM